MQLQAMTEQDLSIGKVYRHKLDCIEEHSPQVEFECIYNQLLPNQRLTVQESALRIEFNSKFEVRVAAYR